MQSLLVLTPATTGNDPRNHQTLELTAVRLVHLQEASRFHQLVKWPMTIGEPEQLAQHVRNGLLRDASENGCPRDEAGEQFASWLHNQYGHADDPITLAMTDAGRDFNFVLTDFKMNVECFRRRVVSVGTLYLRPDDFEVPGLQECCRRAGIEYKHTGRSDPAADATVKLLQHWGVGHG